MFRSYQHTIFGYPLYLLAQNDTIVGSTFSRTRHVRTLASLSCGPLEQSLFFEALPGHLQQPLTAYLAGDRFSLDWPSDDLLLHKGSTFQRTVWKHIEAIPYGKTCCYGEIAQRMGGIQYARAVGGACNANPLALLVPCHRVVAQNDAGGFAADLAIKEKLLRLELETLRADS